MHVNPNHADDVPGRKVLGEQPPGGKIILYCAADLLWATKIKETGLAIGVNCRPVRSLEMLEARLTDSPVGGLLLDLEAGAVVFELLARVRKGGSGAVGNAYMDLPVIAFGPHVDVAKMRAAQEAGASAVMARGALHRMLADVLAALAAGKAGGIRSVLAD